MASFEQRYQQWLAELSQALVQARTEQVGPLVEFVDKVQAYLKAGFYHCDMHSDNVILELVDDKWKAYIIDWALAQHYSEDNILELDWDDWLDEAREGDLEYLVSHLKANKKQPPLWWVKVLEVFEC